MATETQIQTIQEAPYLEEERKRLIKSAEDKVKEITVPGYEVSPLFARQEEALRLGSAGVGAYGPYLQQAGLGTTAGAGLIGQAADIMRGADVRGQFPAAQQALTQAGVPISQLGNLAFAAGQGTPLLGQAAAGTEQAQRMAQAYSQANLSPAQNLMLQSVQQAQAAGPQFGGAQNLLGAGVGSLAGAAQGFMPGYTQAFMNPYQQQVIDESLRQINRQGDIARQSLAAQAARTGAFGGTREGVQRAELERGLAEQRNAAIVGGLSQGYQSAAQQAQQAFEQQQQRQLAQAQGYQGAAGQLGSLEAQRAQQALAAAQYGGNIGQQLAAQSLQQAGLGQGAAGLYGNLAQQQAAMAGQYGNLAQQQAAILGQQAQLGQAQAAGIGSLAAQQFGIGSQLASGIGSLGTQLGAMGLQQGQLGEAAQRLGQQDVTFLYGLGQQQQEQRQRELDALRATRLQQSMMPLQLLSFQSDILSKTPGSQTALTSTTAPTPSPLLQGLSTLVGGAATLGGLKKSGIV